MTRQIQRVVLGKIEKLNTYLPMSIVRAKAFQGITAQAVTPSSIITATKPLKTFSAYKDYHFLGI